MTCCITIDTMIYFLMLYDIHFKLYLLLYIIHVMCIMTINSKEHHGISSDIKIVASTSTWKQIPGRLDSVRLNSDKN